MRILNAVNGADKLLEQFAQKTLDRFQYNLSGVLMGIAYGGDVEMVARLWGDRGTVHGYDTFDKGHPKHLSPNPGSHEATCMDGWYRDFGTSELSLEWQRAELARLGLRNTVLVPGEVTPDSCRELSRIHLAWLDMDLNVSMSNGFLAVKERIVPGGYLCLHDVVPQGHIPGNYELFYGVFYDPDLWLEVARQDESYFCAWQRLDNPPNPT